MTIKKWAVGGAMLLAFAVSAGGGLVLAATNGTLHIGSMVHGDPDDGGQGVFLADGDPPTIRR